MKIRKSSRAILLNSENNIFLFKFEFAMLLGHRMLWVTPGGGVESNESFEQALYREIYEEIGIELNGEYKWIFYRNKPFSTKSGQEFMSEERYYLVKIKHPNITCNNMEQIEKKLTKEWKWWSIEEIKNSSEKFFIDNLDEELCKIINGNIPEEPIEI
ncbi:NUDIX hydrolase [Alkaliphilus peptidifermentans]|uniref:NUDIX domain-containing protein n=1 Tax=Alkaliphilus peptidifermentans DSM 18978 TaxID=1120976 RepID=A0A1G5LF19_9FIRM|nr:NUDIX domain-containing protein [Alkaliphilus peptidifermentans]SCZ11515.1 NUDIX domain-containing protein [Alkaliphilus peptidifermentans DSM 18978]